MFTDLYREAVTLLETYFEKKEPLDISKLEVLIITFLKLAQTHQYKMDYLLQNIDSDHSEASHSVNVALYSIILASQEGYTQAQLVELGLAALLHDTGKSYIPENLIYKTDYLTLDEFEYVKEHADKSEQIAKSFGITNETILAAIRCHHENMDGSGYPRHLKAKAIPKMARIIGLCDAFDAMTTDKPYRNKYSSFNALKLIKNERSEHFDMRLIENYIKLLR